MSIRTIEVVAYNPQWPELFLQEAQRIKEILSDNCVAIHHIGSTSIPGLCAKPILDMLPVVKDIQKVDEVNAAMHALGYEVKGENGILFRRFFCKGGINSTHNVHMYQEDDPEISRYLLFRDWLRAHPEDRDAYGKLKQNLAEEYRHDILGYCNGKDAFVASIDDKSGFDGWRVVKALTNREWQAVKHLGQNLEDLQTQDLQTQEELHLVFYKNSDIIGYSHIQFLPEQTATLKTLVIDKSHRGQGYGTQFLNICKRWLSHQNIQNIIESHCPFYSKQDHTKTP